MMDPIAFVISVAFVAVAVAFASYGPARRAARVDPSLMLRADGSALEAVIDECSRGRAAPRPTAQVPNEPASRHR